MPPSSSRPWRQRSSGWRGGLVAGRAVPADGRAALVSLRPAALDKLKGVQAAGHAVNDQAMAPLSAAERTQYLKLLGKVVAALDGQA